MHVINIINGINTDYSIVETFMSKKTISKYGNCRKIRMDSGKNLNIAIDLDKEIILLN